MGIAVMSARLAYAPRASVETPHLYLSLMVIASTSTAAHALKRFQHYD